MDQQEQGEPTRYLPGSEAQLNHNALAQNISDVGLKTWLDEYDHGVELDMNPGNLYNVQPEQTLDPGFIDDLPSQPDVQQFPQAQPTYPDLEAPPSTTPYYLPPQQPQQPHQPQQYQQYQQPQQFQQFLHQLMNLGGMAQPNPQFPPPAPQNIYNHQSHPLPQNAPYGSRCVTLPLNEYQALVAAQSRKALPPSQPGQSRPAPEDFEQPHSPNSPASPSSSVEGFSRIPWGRNDIKKAKIPMLVRKFYTEPIPRDLNWGRDRKGALAFRYTEAAQWEENITFHKDKLDYYLGNCSLNEEGSQNHKFSRNFRVWVQNHPAQANHRADPIDRKCRYRYCPDKGRTILPGWYRVAFDEFPKLTSKGKKDPFKMAGSMHLWCFEQMVDPAALYYKGVLKADTRDLVREDKNPMSLVKDTADRNIVSETFDRWMKDHQNSGSDPFVPRPHKESLSFALCSHHVKNQTAVRQQTRDARNKKRAPNQKKTIDIHLGDLEMFTGRASKSNAQEAEEDFGEDDAEEVEVEETESVKAADEAVAVLLPTAPSNVEPEYNAGFNPLAMPPVNPQVNAVVDPLGVPPANPRYDAAVNPLGMPPVDPQPRPNLQPLDTSAPPDNNAPAFLDGPDQVDPDLFHLDPQLQSQFEDYAMPDVMAEEQPKGGDDDVAMGGCLTPRSLSHFAEGVEVQQEIPQAVSAESPSSLFDSPTATSPKPKSPTKKRRRSQEDDDEDYVPSGSPKRVRLADSETPQTRRRSSTRSPTSMRETRRRSSARSNESAH